MAQIKIKKGLDIPLLGKPEGNIQELAQPSTVGLDLSHFYGHHTHLLAKEGDLVITGQPIAEDKAFPGNVFLSHATGKILEIRRGKKRFIETVIIELSSQEQYFEQQPLKVNSEKEELVKELSRVGLLSLFRMRPFSLPARPDRLPKSIFVRALESAPYAPPAEMQVEGNECYFQSGLDFLQRLVEERVHLIHREGSDCKAFTDAKNVQIHQAKGPHPISHASVHIQKIDPIRTVDDIIWTLSTNDVICLGKFLTKGQMHTSKVIAIAGEGILPEKRGFFRIREGSNLKDLLHDRLQQQDLRVLSGDPLMGRLATLKDFLGSTHLVVCALLEEKKRKFIHFFRLGRKNYTASRTYLSGFTAKDFSFSTLLHGEPRAFVDPNIYDKVMPLDIPTVPLIKAVISDDYETAQLLGFLEVAPEDFALPTFICPSKIEMVHIVEKGLRNLSEEIFISRI